MHLKIPYGLSNFKQVISEGYTYVDKTEYIAKLEDAGRHLFLLRPRRFGKSLLLSAMEYYYDVGCKDDFDALFSNLYIGKHPTPLKSSYQVLFMEFSGIDTDRGLDSIYLAFDRKIANALQTFLQRYDYPAATHRIIEAEPTPQSRMEAFFRVVSGQKLLLLIDEYDHFANAILSQDLTLFQRIMGKGGFVRSFYETLKTATQRGTLDRLFVTGVTPIMLDSMTSGFNIGENLSLHEDFNEAIGFTKTEVASLLQPLVATCQLDKDLLMADVTRWYNGYRFHALATETVYNANMVLYFAKNFRLKGCDYPKQMLDDNIASDYGKILGMFSIGDRDTNFTVLDDLISGGEVTAEQRRKFDFEKGFDRDDFISLLAYMGFVSLQRETLSGEVFGIPNHVMRELYFRYFKVELERRNQMTISNRAIAVAVETLALRDDIQPLVAEMVQALQLLSNRDAMGMDEKHIKVLLLTLLYQSSVYFIQSEREIDRKYPDILLLERSPIEVDHQHLIELKYSKVSDGETGWATKRQAGTEQVQGYLQLPTIAALPKLSAWLLVSDGIKVEVVKVQ
ncbi:AAA family ATPase [Candidatus Thiothrix anitrata]|uniref:AAA family ATPase n=1 Tax=Candidatus Thiothrix anitrata TaxID=2823902 RepID=A0ABX7X7I0_9GAMM|nr:AAA family ATPase [Candidatus Thiothrix anitrata]QTR49410.1 AAA family ATPase [Candidatus Thiothrix anitrata]